MIRKQQAWTSQELMLLTSCCSNWSVQSGNLWRVGVRVNLSLCSATLHQLHALFTTVKWTCHPELYLFIRQWVYCLILVFNVFFFEQKNIFVTPLEKSVHLLMIFNHTYVTETDANHVIFDLRGWSCGK